MTARARKGVGSVVLAAALFVCVGLGLWPLTAERAAESGSGRTREIVLVARDMAFFLPGETTPNPVLRLKRGERIALTLRNEDAGIAHDFAIPAWDVATKKLDGEGSDRVVFRVPDKAGPADYLCNPHAVMMFGAIAVE
jgi:plastocyanin